MLDVFSNYIVGENVNFKYAKGISFHSGKEFHTFHEIVLFLGGDAEFISETVHTKIKPQTLVIIPKETYHQFVIKGDQNEYLRCVFQFDETASNREFIRDNINKIMIINTDKYISMLFDKLILLSKNNDEFSLKVAEATLTLLIDAIGEKDFTNEDYESNDKVTTAAIKYIGERLTEKLCVEKIAKQLNISTSTLMHSFRSNMNISLHKYILKKRLVLAHSKIESGEPAIAVAAECGFNDYSGFYRQYKKMFDIPPSKSKKQIWVEYDRILCYKIKDKF